MLARDERSRGLRPGWRPCHCTVGHHTRLVAVTGGPGAGKSQLLAELRRSLCEHVVVLPEAASIVFGGGFPRTATDLGRRAAQRSIYRVQVELERVAIEDGRVAVALCDRGTIDGVAYWSGDSAAFLSELGTTREQELGRYAAVIHLRPAPPASYNATDPMRIESAHEAVLLDDALERAWAGHPRRLFVEATEAFDAKLARAFACIRDVLPSCCAVHVGAEVLAGDLVCEP